MENSISEEKKKKDKNKSKRKYLPSNYSLYSYNNYFTVYRVYAA